MFICFEQSTHSRLCPVRYFSNLSLKTLVLLPSCSLSRSHVSFAFEQELETLCSQHNSNGRCFHARTTRANCQLSVHITDFVRFQFFFSTIPSVLLKKTRSISVYDSVINARRFDWLSSGRLSSGETSWLCDDATLIPLCATCKAAPPTAARSSEGELCLRLQCGAFVRVFQRMAVCTRVRAQTWVNMFLPLSYVCDPVCVGRTSEHLKGSFWDVRTNDDIEVVRNLILSLDVCA